MESGEIEGERGFERPKTIEGEPVETLVEIEIEQSQTVPLRDIVWPNASLKFQQVGTYQTQQYGLPVVHPLYTAVFEFKDRDGETTRVVLSDTTGGKSRRKCLFTGSRNGFFAHDPRSRGLDKPFYVIGVNPFELQDDIRHMAGTYHELGHAIIMDEGSDTALFKTAVSLKGQDLPGRRGVTKYAQRLARTIPSSWRTEIKPGQITPKQVWDGMSNRYDVDREMRLFHERYAWAGAAQMIKQHDAPIGFRKFSSIFEYARLCLKSYARKFSDESFVSGIDPKTFRSRNIPTRRTT